MKFAPAWSGRFVMIAVLALTIGMVWWGLNRLDHRPRTQNAYLYADTAGIAPEVSGRIIAITVRDNQRVKKGDVLFQIDPEPYELRLKQVRGQADSLLAQIDLTGRQVESQNSGANAAADQVRRAREQLKLARDSRGRLEPLLEKGYVTEQQIDEVRTNEQTAEVALSAVVQQAAQAHQAVGDTHSLSAQFEAAQAAVALAERDLRNTKVLAPFDGLVVSLSIAEGAFAAAGHPLFTLIKADRWYAVGDFRETELPQIQIGDPAAVWLMWSGNRALKGHVESLGWGVRPENGLGPDLPAVSRTLNWVVVAQRFPVRILLDDAPADVMRVGATVSIRVSHEQHP
ncbi:MAG: multidrug transporter subunit MdtN [Nevskia sp.]|nr:multidrug transporter subunit MdtN [Nevskia sp.]